MARSGRSTQKYFLRGHQPFFPLLLLLLVLPPSPFYGYCWQVNFPTLFVAEPEGGFWPFIDWLSAAEASSSEEKLSLRQSLLNGPLRLFFSHCRRRRRWWLLSEWDVGGSFRSSLLPAESTLPPLIAETVRRILLSVDARGGEMRHG